MRALDRKGRLHVLSNADMGYAYRHSSVPADFIFTSAVFEGYAGDKETIRAAMDEGRTTSDPVLTNYKSKYAVDWSPYLNRKWTDRADTGVPLAEL